MPVIQKWLQIMLSRISSRAVFAQFFYVYVPYIFKFFSFSEMVAAGVITTEQDLIASLLSESLAELSAALSPEKVTPTFVTS
jgi:hypothetical protein